MVDHLISRAPPSGNQSELGVPGHPFCKLECWLAWGSENDVQRMCLAGSQCLQVVDAYLVLLDARTLTQQGVDS